MAVLRSLFNRIISAVDWLKSPTVVYWWVKWFLFWAPVHLRYSFDVQGKKNLPQGGGYIMAQNHQSKADTYVLPVYFRTQISFGAKEELFESWWLGPVVRGTGQVRLVRHGASWAENRRLYREAAEWMDGGRIFGIFPEGTRSKTGKLGRFHTGVGSIARASGRLVVPVGISYSKSLVRTKVRIAIGTPIDVRTFPDRDAFVDELRLRIGELSERELV